MRVKASVTFFVAMIFLLVISVISTTIISAKIQGAKACVCTTFSSAIDSIFAEYDTDIFEKFGVLLLDENNEESISEKIRAYVTDNLKNNEGVDLYGIQVEDVNLLNCESIIGQGGLLWMDEIVDYEKYAKAIDMASDYLKISKPDEEIKLMETATDQVTVLADLAGFISDEIRKLGKVIDGVEIKRDYVEKIDNVEFLKDSEIYFPYMSLENLKALIVQKDTHKLQEEKDKLIANFNMLLSTSDKAKEIIKTINNYMNQMSFVTDETRKYVKGVENILGSEFVQGFCEDITPMEKYNDILTEKVCNIEQIEKTIIDNEHRIIEIKKKVTDCSSIEAVEEIIDLCSEYNYKDLKIDYTYFYSQKSENGLLKNIKKLFKEGIVSMVLPEGDTISTRMINLNNLASSSVILDSKKLLSDCDVITKNEKRIIYGEYVMDNFYSYVDKKDGTAFNYEVEYVLNGKKSDVENLYYTIKQIATIRSVVNLACIMTDSEKKEQVEDIARLAVGWTNVEPLVKAVKYILLYAWSYAESLTEVKALLSGWKIPIIKKKSDWNMEYAEFISLNFIPKEDKCKKGLDYKMYLRALLLFMDEGKKSAYTMDLVELWKIAKGDADFRLKDCLYSMVGKIKYGVSGVEKTYEYVMGQTY